VKNSTLACHLEPRRISCLLVGTTKMDKILIKQSRNKKNPTDVFLISLQFKEDLETIKSDFGEQFDKQLKQLITDYVGVTEEPEGLPPHRDKLHHKVKLTGVPPRKRRNRLTVDEYDEFKRQCTKLFQQGKIRVSNNLYASLIVMVRKADGSVRVCINYRAINERAVRD